MDRYKTLQVLGDGSFGVVVKAENLKTGEIVTIICIIIIFKYYKIIILPHLVFIVLYIYMIIKYK